VTNNCHLIVQQSRSIYINHWYLPIFGAADIINRCQKMRRCADTTFAPNFHVANWVLYAAEMIPLGRAGG
jgi:hypothetical protein